MTSFYRLMCLCMKTADCNITENIRTTKYVCRILVIIASKEHLQRRSPWQRRYWQDSREHW